MVRIVLIILALLEISLLIMTISLIRSSHYPGAEIGNLDGWLAKLSGGVFLVIALVIAWILRFKKG